MHSRLCSNCIIRTEYEDTLCEYCYDDLNSVLAYPLFKSHLFNTLCFGNHDLNYLLIYFSITKIYLSIFFHEIIFKDELNNGFIITYEKKRPMLSLRMIYVKKNILQLYSDIDIFDISEYFLPIPKSLIRIMSESNNPISLIKYGMRNISHHHIEFGTPKKIKNISPYDFLINNIYKNKDIFFKYL